MHRSKPTHRNLQVEPDGWRGPECLVDCPSAVPEQEASAAVPSTDEGRGEVASSGLAVAAQRETMHGTTKKGADSNTLLAQR